MHIFGLPHSVDFTPSCGLNLWSNTTCRTPREQPARLCCQGDRRADHAQLTSVPPDDRDKKVCEDRSVRKNDEMTARCRDPPHAVSRDSKVPHGLLRSEAGIHGRIKSIEHNPDTLRRPEWRPQSAVSNRRPRIGALALKLVF